MLEAIHTATPVVTCPLFSDQTANALFLQHCGVAVPLSPFTATKTEILNAMNTIVNDTKYDIILYLGSRTVNVRNFRLYFRTAIEGRKAVAPLKAL